MRTYRTRNHALAASWTVLLLALFLGGTTSAQSKSYLYDRIAVTIDVRQDGTLDVVETMTLKYQGGPFSSANRSIALQRLDDIRDFSLSEEGRAYAHAQSGKQPGTFVVQRTASSMNVTWYYPPTSNTLRTFTLRYRVAGAVRVGATEDEIWWIAVFPDRTVPVQHSQVLLNLPGGGKLRREDITLPAAAGAIAVEENSVRVARDEPLATGESLDLRVRFPSTLVSAQKPAWQDMPVAQPVPRPQPNPSGPSESAGRRLGPGVLGLICLLPLAIAIIVGTAIWRAFARTRRLSSSGGARRSSGWSSNSSSWNSGSSSWDSGSSSSSWDSGGSSDSGGGDSGSGGGGGGAE